MQAGNGQGMRCFPACFAPPPVSLPRNHTHRPRELGADLLRLVRHRKLIELHIQIQICEIRGVILSQVDHATAGIQVAVPHPARHSSLCTRTQTWSLSTSPPHTGLEHAGQHPDEGGLPRPVLPQHNNDLGVGELPSLNL